MDDAASSGPGLFAERLEYLVQTRKSATGKKPTNSAIADAINTEFGEKSITAGYVWQLRKGVRDNPTYRAIRGLAWYFNVSAQYFFDEPNTAELDTARALAVQADGLSEAAQQAISAMIQQARALEELPVPPARTSRSASPSA